MTNGKVVIIKQRHKKNRLYRSIWLTLSFLILVSFATDSAIQNAPAYHMVQTAYAKGVLVDSIPKWNGKPYTEINQGKPSFSDKQKRRTKEYVKYGKLDKYNRPRAAIGCLGPKTLNNEERVIISSVKPVGWHTKKYPGIISDRYVYNRCHLLMQAAAAGIKEDECNSYKNLITGTRYLNVDGMLPFETRVLEYIMNTKNHVMYRVTPIYKGKQLVARGVQMEAYSVEDDGKGICFNVYCYNIQPGIKKTTAQAPQKRKKPRRQKWRWRYKTVHRRSIQMKKQTRQIIHFPWCSSVSQMKAKNKWSGHFSRSELIANGYVPCGECNP